MSHWVKYDPSRGTLDPDGDGRSWQGPAGRGRAAMRGLLIFLLPLASMFALVISAYMMRRHVGDWQPIPLPWQVWLSTVLLVGSSIAFEVARRAAALGHIHDIRRGLLGTGVLAVAFLGSQLWAWFHLQEQGYYLAANPANSFFYLMSGLHGLHLIAGLVAWSKTRSALTGGADVASVQLYVQLCAIYWHFLLVVWLLLFGVLFWVS
ncbi:cytochrome c oxidase subunit 3 [Aquisalimonas sp.]|uniref:cytochrome c oxidase subunit 3 n=1 Tax=Aquisalimonas sp. TaxID=1872621 RepID=UPI0025BA45A7|nr:cytochrome c oxidase subunit 3 [Aquisalimonas sp.]